ncbi:ankyrin repeat domain-containing protein [Candidatus Bathyarchaeota archaeon]|nr:ankyrin repeat domain-containing protein [Candidatus Bathyarchaeota archaeon]
MLTMQTEEFLNAIRNNENQKVVELLKKEPSLANARHESGVSAIFLALYRGNMEIVREIASRKSLDIFEAAATGDLDRVKKLVDSDKSLVASKSPDGFTALALASYLGQKGTAEYLIRNGADPNAVATDGSGFTPLTGAVSQNHNDVAKLLIQNGANVNYKYEGGFTPLMHAAAAGNVELVKILLEGGADPNARNGEGKTPLSFASENKHQNVVELLKKHGAA